MVEDTATHEASMAGRQSETHPAIPRTPDGFGATPPDFDFIGVRGTVFPTISDPSSLGTMDFANLVVEPPGRMRMPPCHVVNRAVDDYRLAPSPANLPDGKFPTTLPYPAMTLTTLRDAFCLPWGPPFLPAQGTVVTDVLIPWSPDVAPWFSYRSGDIYRMESSVDLSETECDLDVAFYLDNPVSEHFGHFIGDCLCRMYAWDILREIYGDIKVIIGRSRTPNDFQAPLLRAAGATSDDIIMFSRQIRCRRLLLATPSLGVEHYASPTSARLWGRIRDAAAKRDITLPDRIYLTRSGIPTRRLVNEAQVEAIFARAGFTIVRPELLSGQQQTALVSNALLIAGTSGSGMFNLAFQGRLRSAFILAREGRLQLSEMLLCAGSSCDLWYHLGTDVMPTTKPAHEREWLVDPDRLASDVADWVAASMN